MKDIKEMSFEPKWREDAKRAYYTIESMGERIMTIGEEEIDELMSGSIDIHLHAYPDPLIDTGWDQLNIAKKACEAEMEALLFKSHTFPTVITVPFVQKAINKYAEEIGKKPIKVFGGITLNNYVGGLNPESVEMAIRLGAKVIRLPSHDANHHHKVLEEPKKGIEILTENDELVPSLKEIFKMVAEKDLLLETGHIGTKEKFVVLKEAKNFGIKRILITHPDWNVTKASIEEQEEMGKMGAYIGLFMYGAVPHFNNPNCDPLEMFEIIKKVGPEHIVIATDLGTAVNVHPVEGMKLFLRILLAGNVKKEDIEKMVKENPSYLLNLR